MAVTPNWGTRNESSVDSTTHTCDFFVTDISKPILVNFSGRAFATAAPLVNNLGSTLSPTEIQVILSQGNAEGCVAQYYVKPSQTGLHTFTATYSASVATKWGQAAEISGSDGATSASFIDASSGGFPSSDPYQVNITTTVDDAYIIHLGINGGARNISNPIPSGAVIHDQRVVSNIGADSTTWVIEYQAGVAATYGVGANKDGSSIDHRVVQVAIAPSVAPPPPYVDEDGASWPKTGTATAEAMGVETFSSAGAQFDGGITRPGYSGAASVVRAVDGTLSLMTIGPLGRRFAEGNTEHAARCSIGFEDTGGITGPSDHAILSLDTVGGSVIVKAYFIDDSQNRGVSLYIDPASDGTVTQFLSIDAEVETASPVFAYGEIMDVVWIVHRNAAGWAQLVVNGVLIAEVTGIDTTAAGAAADGSWSIVLPAKVGVRHLITAPIATFGAVADVIAEIPSPIWSEQPGSWAMQRVAVPHWEPSSLLGAHLQPDNWTNVALVDYGGNMRRRRYQISGTGKRVVAPQYNLGTLPGGSVGIFMVQDMLRNGTEAWTFDLKDDTGATIALLTMTATGSVFDGANEIITGVPVGYFSLSIHVNKSTGVMSCFVESHTEVFATAQTTFSGDIVTVTWSGQAIGKPEIGVTATAGVPEIGTMAMMSELSSAIVDSLTSTPENIPPNYARWNRLTAQVDRNWETTSLPNAPIYRRKDWEDNGLAPMFSPIWMGRTGNRLDSFGVNAAPDLVNGILLWWFDGASINNLNRINGSDPAAELAILETGARAILDQQAAVGGRSILIANLDRPTGAAWNNNGFTDQERDGANQWRVKLQELAAEYGQLYVPIDESFNPDQSGNPDGLYTVPDYIHIANATLWWDRLIPAIAAAAGWPTIGDGIRFGYWAYTPEALALPWPGHGQGSS